jgi:4-amino-4-deoxy-L-arabinose transferase-like glycosyltransferase
MVAKLANSRRACDPVLILALLATAATSLFLLSNYYCISVDGVRYIAAARHLYAGNFKAALSGIDPPGYPFVIAVFFGLFGDWERAGQLASMAAAILLLVPLYALLADMYDRRTAALACCLAAVHPYMAQYSVHVRSESLFFFLTILVLTICYRAIQQRHTGKFFFGGAITGFAYLVRPEAIAFLVLVPAVLLLFRWLKKDWDVGAIIKVTSALVAGFAIFAAPYVLYLSKATGNWGAVSRKAGITLYVSLEEADLLDDEVLKDFPTRASMSLPELVRRHPIIYAKKILHDIVPSVAIYFEALYYSYAPFLLIGLIVAFRQKPWERRDFFLLAYGILFAAMFLAVFVNRRYSVQLVPASLGWTALGIVWCRDRINHAASSRAALLAVAVLTLAFLGGTLPKTLKPVAREKAYLKDAGLYLRDRHGSGTLDLLVYDQRIAFYANARGIELVRMSEAELISRLRERKARFLVAEPQWLQTHYPGVLEAPEAYGLRFEKEFIGSRRDRLIIYRVT